MTTKDDGQANDDKKDTDKEPVDELAGQRSDDDSTGSTGPSQPTSTASKAEEDPPDDKDPDTEPQTAPRPTQQEMMDRFSVRVAPRTEGE